MNDERRIAFRPGEVAARLGCSDDTVGRLIASGALRSFLIGERFIAEREAEQNT